MIIVSVASSLAGCGTPKEKTAPCKRPANLAGYVAEAPTDCGAMWAVNTDSNAALAAIDDLAARAK
jgi:hypothetical protein